MGKKKVRGEYNDFLDGEKLRDNTAVRTSLQGDSTTLSPNESPPQRGQNRKGGRGPTKGKQASKNPPLTHFLCLPLVNEASRPQWKLALDKLKEDLTHSGLVSLKAVRPLGTLHLTLGVMSLDAPQLARAQQYLADLDLAQLLDDVTASPVPEHISNIAPDTSHPLRITLEALVPMRKPAQTSILYAEPRDASQRLLAIGKALRERFQGEGLMVEDKRDLKLHATVINTIYAKPKGKGSRKVGTQGGNRAETSTEPASGEMLHNDDTASVAGSAHDDDEGRGDDRGEAAAAAVSPTDQSTALDGRDGHGPNAKSWMRFDARDLMSRYADFVWARDVHIDRVQICKMGAAKILDDGGDVVDEKYEVVAEKVI